MTLITRGGNLVVVNGALSNNPECCCCPCPNCPSVCRYCCIEFDYFEVDWTRCACQYLSFIHNPAAGQSSHCLTAPLTSCAADNKGKYWVSSCTYRLPGYWRCRIDESDQAGVPAGCGMIEVTILSATTLQVTVVSGPTEDCFNGPCTSELSETITITLPNMNTPVANICTDPLTPPTTTHGNGLSGSNNCVGEVRFDYNVNPCCPAITTDCQGGGGGGDEGYP